MPDGRKGLLVPSAPGCAADIEHAGPCFQHSERRVSQVMVCDVLVVGGGTAGVTAAIASARTGANTVLLERSDDLGGVTAFGMVIAGHVNKAGDQTVAGLLNEFIRRIDRGGGLGNVRSEGPDRWIGAGVSVHPEAARHIWRQMLKESGVRVYYHTEAINVVMDGGTIRQVQGLFLGTRIVFSPTIVIDATGNADVVTLAGFPTAVGDEHGWHQGLSCVMQLAGLDLASYERYMNETINTDGRAPWQLVDACCRGGGGAYWLPWRFSGDNSFPNTCGPYYHGNDGELFLNATHTGGDPLNPDDYACALDALRTQALKITAYLRENVPGCEKIFLAGLSPLGIRESRRINGDYTLTERDMLGSIDFEDSVAMGAYPCDIHSDVGDVDMERDRVWAYHIPYRSLLVQDADNLLAAGRCIATTFAANAGVRGMAVCIATGQAAGNAAGLAVATGRAPREIDTAVLRQTLRDAGCVL